MREFMVEDKLFASLLARWVWQSVLSTGKSGGAAHTRSDANSEVSHLISFNPYTSKTPYSRFPVGWRKLSYFKYAHSNMGLLMTVLAAKYGKDFKSKLRALKIWYITGTIDAEEVLIPAAKILLKFDSPIILYGRDCLPLYRTLQGIRKNIYYAEGVSRLAINNSERHSYTRQDRKSYLLEYLENLVPDRNLRKLLLHVDTGFNGTVPNACIKVLGHTEGLRNIKMLSSHYTRLSLGFKHDDIIKMEYRPKMFFRAVKWTNKYLHTDLYMPEMRVSGDAAYAAVHLIGVMAAAKAYKRKDTCLKKNRSGLQKKKAFKYAWKEQMAKSLVVDGTTSTEEQLAVGLVNSADSSLNAQVLQSFVPSSHLEW